MNRGQPLHVHVMCSSECVSFATPFFIRPARETSSRVGGESKRLERGRFHGHWEDLIMFLYKQEVFLLPC